jgi:probable F420-dependent oxidoreductase
VCAWRQYDRLTHSVPLWLSIRLLSTLRIGAKLPNSGPLPQALGIAAMARALETSGFDSLWVADHVVQPRAIDSRYPFAADGRATWPTDAPYVEALIALALAASVTERATLGTAVLVLPLRSPVMFAKQAASIDTASGGRLKLGVGAGWLEEEFEALDVPFADRGGRTEEWIELARNCWTGTPAAHASARYTLPANMLMVPPPDRPIPILMGGHSRVALARAGRLTDGWLGQQALPELDTDELEAAAAEMREAAQGAGRDPAGLEVVLRIVQSAGHADELARRLPALAAAGVDEVIVDLDWDGDLAAQHATLRGAV